VLRKKKNDIVPNPLTNLLIAEQLVGNLSGGQHICIATVTLDHRFGQRFA